MTDRPLVSVIMAAYNGARYVGSAIESVLDQSYPAVELVVVDDASTDDTVGVIERYVAAAPDRVRLTRLTRNSGPCHARNVALEQCRGDLVCWLDDDDLWKPTKVERQVSVMLERPEVGLVYTYFDAFDSETGAVLEWSDGRRDNEGDILADLFMVGCFVGSVTVMFRRAALDLRDTLLRERDFSFGDDYYLWLMIALDWQVARLPEILALYRRHAGNESSRVSRGNAHLMTVGLLREFIDAFPETKPRLGANRRRAIARHLLLAAGLEVRRGERARAVGLRIRAATLDPSCLLTGPRRRLLEGR